MQQTTASFLDGSLNRRCFVFGAAKGKNRNFGVNYDNDVYNVRVVRGN